MAHDNRRFMVASVLLGIGLGGFFDGIVLHQILQWHHLVSHVYEPTTLTNLQLNTTMDGLFHAATWIVTVAGVIVLASAPGSRAAAGARRRLLGGALIGWGGFNLVEGVIDHHILQIHHVRPGQDQALWDLGFLAWGAAMVVIGVVLVRRSATTPTAAIRSSDGASAQ
jgi:uncharacterized membrane protein